MTLKDKVVIITGASSGIGKATTELLAKQGAKLVIAARRKERLDAIKDALPDACISTIKADVTNFEDVQAVVDYAVDKFGRVDAMFNNAGIMPVNPLSKGQRQEWQNILDVNVMGVLNGGAADHD
jgi:NADP-dependent 3-hydroxy acid dehydrogenase YdfG